MQVRKKYEPNGFNPNISFLDKILKHGGEILKVSDALRFIKAIVQFDDAKSMLFRICDPQVNW